MANHMVEVAKMLGVELGEEFMCNNGYKYVLREDGVMDSKYNNDNRFDGYIFSGALHDLLTGELSIERKPWKPKANNKYYSIGPSGVIEIGCWMNDFIDMAMYKLGNCYRTSEEAEANRAKWIKFYASDEVLEV